MEPTNSQNSTDQQAFKLKLPNKIPGLNLNFDPPKSLLKKLGNNEPTNSNPMTRERVSSNENKSYEELLQNVRPIDVAKRLNFTHLAEMRTSESSNASSSDKMDIDQNSDTENECIDLSNFIIPTDEREKLLKIDVKNNSTLVEPVVSDMKNLHLLGESEENSYSLEDIFHTVTTKRSKSPPRPRLPCLLDDFEYFSELHQNNKTIYEKKWGKEKISGMAKVISFEMQETCPVLNIDFQYIPPPPSTIQQFKFDTPSPDELYVLNLEKNKKKKPKFLVP